MKRLLVPSVALSIITLAHAALAQAPATGRAAKTVERQAAINSIQAQLKAFGRDDYKTAILYQSTGLKKNFLTPDAFRTMMLRTYPEFAHYKRVVFGPARCDLTGAHLQILASVTGQDGVTVPSVYLMVREGKTYRVEGVAGGAQTPPDIAAPANDV
jgi:hypothetical protein